MKNFKSFQTELQENIVIPSTIHSVKHKGKHIGFIMAHKKPNGETQYNGYHKASCQNVPCGKSKEEAIRSLKSFHDEINS